MADLPNFLCGNW